MVFLEDQRRSANIVGRIFVVHDEDTDEAAVAWVGFGVVVSHQLLWRAFSLLIFLFLLFFLLVFLAPVACIQLHGRFFKDFKVGIFVFEVRSIRELTADAMC